MVKTTKKGESQKETESSTQIKKTNSKSRVKVTVIKINKINRLATAVLI